MAFREVTVLEIKEVLRQWLAGAAKKRIAARVGLDPKTVRRYVRAAEKCGLAGGSGEQVLDDKTLGAVVAELGELPLREYGEAWRRCDEHRAFIAAKLASQVRLSKVRRLLRRQGVEVPYSTLHRFAVVELGFGRKAATVPVLDGEPGKEVQLDTGWMVLLEPDEKRRRRKFRAWIFTPSFSRYRFVWPCRRESTEEAIEACERAWEFYGGVFGVLIPDNTKAIVQEADPLEPLITPGFLEYAQARDFVIDPTRARKPKDKARVERSVRDVRDDCFGGECIRDLDHAREHAVGWCRDEYGMRPHSTTNRMPRELFESEEWKALRPAPTEPYDIPLWADPKVGRDHFAQVAGALYTLPTRYIGRRLRARADSRLVLFYAARELIKTHPRKPKGGKSIDPSDFPADRRPYAMRDVLWLERQAHEHGESVGMFAKRVLASPLPWTSMRTVRALLSLCKRYGDAPVEQACARALAADMTSVYRLERMVKHAITQPVAPKAKVIPIARFLRPATTYTLPRTCDRAQQGEKE
jgi:transposase